MRDFRQGVFDEVYLVYNKFLNAATQEVQTEKLLPITMPEKKEAEKSAIETDYIFEPNRTEILETLIPKSIKTQVYKAILDSVASEHGARMTAMHKATDNAQALKMTWLSSTTKHVRLQLPTKSWKLYPEQKL